MYKSWLLGLVTMVFAWVLLTHLQELTVLGRTVAGGHWPWLLTALGLQLLYYLAYTAVYQFAFATVDVRSTLG